MFPVSWVLLCLHRAFSVEGRCAVEKSGSLEMGFCLSPRESQGPACLLHPTPHFFTPGGFGAQLCSAFRQMTKLTLNPQGKMTPQCRESRRFSK